MIRLFRHISVHLWLTSMAAIPFCFVFLSFIKQIFPEANSVLIASAIILAVFVVFEFLLDRIVRKMISYLIREGKLWERSGINKRAEKCYLKAIRLYDSFLLWPFSVNKTAKSLTGTVSRFGLNMPRQHRSFSLASSVYLKMNPEDEDVACLWLKQIHKVKTISNTDQEVLSVLAEKHSENERVSKLIIPIFLSLERKDFTAVKLYEKAQSASFLDLHHHLQKSEAMMADSNQTLGNEFKYEVMPEKPAALAMALTVIKTGLKKSLKTMGWIKASGVRIWHAWTIVVIKMFQYIRVHDNIQFYIKMAVFTGIGVWILIFSVNTVSHLFKTRTIEHKKGKIEIQVPKPFTIQVASYLKLKHAQRYVNILKEKGVDANIKQVDGRGKTWFVVRVSEFVDKKSAADYGQQLKSKKIIDDFFVNNK